MLNVNDLLHQRVLITEKMQYNSTGPVTEVKFLEISPSGNWVKLLNMYGKKYWKPVTEIKVIEVLKDIKAEKPVE